MAISRIRPDHYPVEKACDSCRCARSARDERKQIVEAETLCRNRKLFDLRPYRPRKLLPSSPATILQRPFKDRFEPVIRAKMKNYPSEILTSPSVTMIYMTVNAAQNYIDQSVDLLFFTGGMSVDPDDLTPAAIRRLGADIITHGVPSQPGNMTLIAYRDDAAIMGIPGAAVSLLRLFLTSCCRNVYR